VQILGYMQDHGYEQLVACHDPSVGLKAFIAIYDTSLGPALGGVRLWPYSNEEEALTDVLRLARALAYKCAVAGLAFGGGKATIIADSSSKTEALMRAFARFVDTLGGRFIVSEDVGTDIHDLECIAQETDHVAGLPLALGGSGDPSIITGLGVVMAMKSCAKAVWGSESLCGRTIAIQGFGKVATHAAEELLKEGANIVVADIQSEAAERAKNIGATVVSPDEIYGVSCDIFSPCALGGVLNSETIPKLKAKVIAGGANNQLLSPTDGDTLHQRGILYAPDFVASAGGCIALHHEVYGDYREELLPDLAHRVGEIMDRVICRSRSEKIPTYLAAEFIAEERMKSVRQLKPIYRRNGHESAN
jgi:leucine dehydrogenase